MYQPIKPFILNQYFGENKTCVSLDGTSKFITCDGYNPPTGFKSVYDSRGHLGIDCRGNSGTRSCAAYNGRVSSIDTNLKTGLDVRIEHEYQGEKYRTIHEHLLAYTPKVGDWVETGQLVGWVGSTGFSSGPHLHFQFEKWIDGAWIPQDPLPFMFEKSAEDWRNERIAILQKALESMKKVLLDWKLKLENSKK